MIPNSLGFHYIQPVHKYCPILEKKKSKSCRKLPPQKLLAHEPHRRGGGCASEPEAECALQLQSLTRFCLTWSLDFSLCYCCLQAFQPQSAFVCQTCLCRFSPETGERSPDHHWQRQIVCVCCVNTGALKQKKKKKKDSPKRTCLFFKKFVLIFPLRVFKMLFLAPVGIHSFLVHISICWMVHLSVCLKTWRSILSTHN